jgi:hypothetical protein
MSTNLTHTTIERAVASSFDDNGDLFFEHNALYGRLSQDEQASIDRLRTSAQWYAWGRNDARPSEAVSAFDFGLWYGVLAARVVIGLTAHRPAIQDEWLRFKDATLAARAIQADQAGRP